ncbi:unnamed protein product [Paramecium pentaurelia]|uniref:Transmembrane protein n=1 Tax=Paramecium pentaurelia TaxID=43138 RepID=A0A8S1VAY7_9CILI|nr:unnamed protein product [Paramecium pentaurelia]
MEQYIFCYHLFLINILIIIINEICKNKIQDILNSILKILFPIIIISKIFLRHLFLNIGILEQKYLLDVQLINAQKNKRRELIQMFLWSRGIFRESMNLFKLQLQNEAIMNKRIKRLRVFRILQFGAFLQLADEQYQAMQPQIKADDDISFFKSNSTIYFLGVDLFYYMKDKDNFKKCSVEILGLFGNIKYSNEQEPFKLELTSQIDNLCKIIYQFTGNGLLKYNFHNREYFGAAHGILGVIQMLLLSFMSNAKNIFIQKMNKNYLKCQNPFKQHQTIQLKFIIKTVIFWCQLKIKKMQNYISLLWDTRSYCSNFKSLQDIQQIRLLYTAIHMIEQLYKLEQLRKIMGYGIEFKETNLRRYAYQFLQYIKNPYIFNEIKNFPFNDRYIIGISDNPFSLMLRNIRDMCAMMDFINYKRMPGYEI